jgi:hypothetical protein
MLQATQRTQKFVVGTEPCRNMITPTTHPNQFCTFVLFSLASFGGEDLDGHDILGHVNLLLTKTESGLEQAHPRICPDTIFRRGRSNDTVKGKIAEAYHHQLILAPCGNTDWCAILIGASILY